MTQETLQAEVVEPTTALVPQSQAVQRLDWSGAASRAVEAKKARDKLITGILEEDVHYGVIQGTDKPTLYKAGAEMVTDALNLWPEFVVETRVEDWDRPLFYYQVRCNLRVRGLDAMIATGLGSCNSMEERYRYRKAERTCPKCGKPAIIKGKKEYGGGWLCWNKRNGCGEKWMDGAREIESQSVEKVENEEPFTLVNTLLKMAMKRAHVAATLALGFSGKFTQDLDDALPPEEPVEPKQTAPKSAAAKPGKAAGTPPPAAPIPLDKSREGEFVDQAPQSVKDGYVEKDDSAPYWTSDWDGKDFIHAREGKHFDSEFLAKLGMKDKKKKGVYSAIWTKAIEDELIARGKQMEGKGKPIAQAKPKFKHLHEADVAKLREGFRSTGLKAAEMTKAIGDVIGPEKALKPEEWTKKDYVALKDFLGPAFPEDAPQ